jgi:hypothetical protein
LQVDVDEVKYELDSIIIGPEKLQICKKSNATFKTQNHKSKPSTDSETPNEAKSSL